MWGEIAHPQLSVHCKRAWTLFIMTSFSFLPCQPALHCLSFLRPTASRGRLFPRGFCTALAATSAHISIRTCDGRLHRLSHVTPDKSNPSTLTVPSMPNLSCLWQSWSPHPQLLRLTCYAALSHLHHQSSRLPELLQQRHLRRLKIHCSGYRQRLVAAQAIRRCLAPQSARRHPSGSSVI